ncbi:MAG: ribosome assembly cofactor RimP [Paludibacter sp.]|nr:MAG: ribosome assembly cofactor RimP [Paludibacter sp.]
MISRDIIRQVVEDFIVNTDYFLVDIEIGVSNQIKVYIDSYHNVSLDFCVQLTKEIEKKLDRDIEDYHLEVSSAGITSPFKVDEQYNKNLENEVEIFTIESKKIVGKLLNHEEGKITVEIETKEKPEGAKRKIIVKKELVIPKKNIKVIKQHFRFK